MPHPSLVRHVRLLEAWDASTTLRHVCVCPGRIPRFATCEAQGAEVRAACAGQRWAPVRIVEELVAVRALRRNHVANDLPLNVVEHVFAGGAAKRGKSSPPLRLSIPHGLPASILLCGFHDGLTV